VAERGGDGRSCPRVGGRRRPQRHRVGGTTASLPPDGSRRHGPVRRRAARRYGHPADRRGECGDQRRLGLRARALAHSRGGSRPSCQRATPRGSSTSSSSWARRRRARCATPGRRRWGIRRSRSASGTAGGAIATPRAGT
jgi:hypothetical protein